MNSPVRPQVIQVDATSPLSARKRASDILDSDYSEGWACLDSCKSVLFVCFWAGYF